MEGESQTGGHDACQSDDVNRQNWSVEEVANRRRAEEPQQIESCVAHVIGVCGCYSFDVFGFFGGGTS